MKISLSDCSVSKLNCMIDQVPFSPLMDLMDRCAVLALSSWYDFLTCSCCSGHKTPWAMLFLSVFSIRLVTDKTVFDSTWQALSG